MLLVFLMDTHVWELSERIPDLSELVDLGIKVLKIPDRQVDLTWTRHKPDAKLAARELLQIWLKKQTNRREAYTNLIASLQEGEMNQLAAELQTWVGESIEPSEKRLYKRILILCCSDQNIPFCR